MDWTEFVDARCFPYAQAPPQLSLLYRSAGALPRYKYENLIFVETEEARGRWRRGVSKSGSRGDDSDADSFIGVSGAVSAVSGASGAAGVASGGV